MSCQGGCQSNCESCNTSEKTPCTCETAQYACTTNQKASAYFSDFGKGFTGLCSGQTINIQAAKWNQLINFLKSSYNVKGRPDTEPNLAANLSTVKSGDPITAEAYNKIATAFGGLSDSNTSPAGVSGGANGTIIHHTHFQELINKYNTFKLNSEQCIRCLSSCQRCDECQACNKGCQVHSGKGKVCQDPKK